MNSRRLECAGQGVIQAATQTQRGPLIAKKLKTGELLFYPPHGVARVAGVEDRDFGGVKQSFYLLELHLGGNVLLPTSNTDVEGLRPLISANKAKQLMRKMKIRPDLKLDEPFKARAAGYNEELHGGEAERYTDVLRELLYRGKEDKLSTSEQNLLDSARSFFLAELSTVLGCTEDKVEDDMTVAVEKGS